MSKEKFTVDLSKPLAFQVGHLGEAYNDWVHQPILSKEGPRMFENNVIELMSRTPWFVVPLFWGPVVCWLVAWSIKEGVPLIVVPPAMLAGVFIAMLREYVIHRFVFHFKPSTYWVITLHYVLHGFHHKHPMDRLRLVLSPAATLLLSLLFWNLTTKRLIPAPYSSAVFGGEMLGYTFYDCMHYYFHHARSFSYPSFLTQLKRNHINHHFKDQYKGFGVTTTFFDRVFGTSWLTVSKKPYQKN